MHRMWVQLKHLGDEGLDVFDVVVEVQLFEVDEFLELLACIFGKDDLLETATLLAFDEPVRKFELVLGQAVEVVIRLDVNHRGSMYQINTRYMDSAFFNTVQLCYTEAYRIVSMR